VITAHQLDLRYQGLDRPALAGLDLDLPEGTVLGVVGPMGAGKTSLCQLLAGLAPRTTGGDSGGSLSVDGSDPREAPVADIARVVGMVFEDYAAQLTQVTVLGEVMAPLINKGIAPAAARDTAMRLLDELGLSELDVEHKRTWELSGGQQQRVAIAASLAPGPRLLILDNVTGLLDPQGKQEVSRLVDRLSHRMTMVVVEDDVDLLLGITDTVLVLAGGQVRALGPATDVLRDVDLLAAAQVDPPTVVQVARGAGLSELPLSGDELAGATRVRGESASRRDATAPAATPPRDGPPVVEVRGVTYRYPDGTAALEDVSLSVPRGWVHAVVGGNGAGKSTLLRMLVGLIRPQDGAVHVAGEDASRRSPAELARWLGTALQNPDEQITERTVAQEIGHPLQLRRYERTGWFGFGRRARHGPDQVAERVEEARRLVGLPEELMEHDPTHLSHGQRKLVTIAAALALQAEVLVLDEPRVGLDAPARAALRRLLLRLREQGTAVVVVEHDLDLVAETADSVTVLHRGRVLAQGSPAALFSPSNTEVFDATPLLPPRAAALAGQLGVEAMTVAELAAALDPVRQEA